LLIRRGDSYCLEAMTEDSALSLLGTGEAGSAETPGRPPFPQARCAQHEPSIAERTRLTRRSDAAGVVTGRLEAAAGDGACGITL